MQWIAVFLILSFVLFSLRISISAKNSRVIIKNG